MAAVLVCGEVARQLQQHLSVAGVSAVALPPGIALEAFLDTRDDVHAAAVCVVAPRLPSLTSCTLTEWEQRVTRPLAQTFAEARAILSHWLGEGTAGVMALVQVGADPVVGDALEALARSIAKEYGRRGVRCNLVCTTEVRSATAEVVKSALSPAFGFVSGQRFVAAEVAP